MSRPVDPDDGLQELFDLWSAPTADALHRGLVLHQPVRGSADALEPFALVHRSITNRAGVLADHRGADPDRSSVGERAWRLVRRIADSGIFDADQLDLLARTFLAADDAIYWQSPDDGGPDGEGDDVPEEGRTVAGR